MAVSAAIVVHVGLIFVIPYLTSLDTAPLPDYGPIKVTLEEPTASTARAARAPAEDRAAPSPTPAERTTPATAPEDRAGRPRRRLPQRPPHRRRLVAPRQGASSFRQSGATTGTSAGTALGVDRLGSAARDPSRRRRDDPRFGRAALRRGGRS